MRAALVMCALAACSYPEKELIDSNGPPYGCLGAPAPTKADNPVILSGTTIDPFTSQPVGNATIVGRLPTLTTPIFTTHSDATGHFRQSQGTGGAPLDLFFAVSAAGYIDTYYYPPYPVTHDVTLPVTLLTQADAGTLAGAAQLTFDPADGNILMTVNDCNGKTVAGATVTTSPAGTVRYFNMVTPSTSATATDTYGVAMVANLPPGNVMITASVGGMQFRSHNFQVVAGAFLQTQLQP